jgi:hypothetical protein
MQVRRPTQHRYKVGQLVDLNSRRLGISASSRGYKVVRLLPREGTELLYRIKSPNESFERVVKEQDLVRRDPT